MTIDLRTWINSRYQITKMYHKSENHTQPNTLFRAGVRKVVFLKMKVDS